MMCNSMLATSEAESAPFRFVHISDTHFGPDRSYTYQGRCTYDYARRLVEAIAALPFSPEFVIHTGDVATNPSDGAYEQAREVFSSLKVPMYFATGNHDNARDIRRYLELGPCEKLPADENVLSYAFSSKGYRFVVFDARGPESIDPQGLLSEQQLDFLRAELKEGSQPLLVFGHYPVLPFYSPWFDANMRIQNGEELHRMLIEARTRVRGVFYGHVHQSLQTTRDGVTYTSVPSSFFQFAIWPHDQQPSFDPAYPPGFNVVTLTPQDTLIRQHIFAPPV